jgi:hypothetical protein
MVNLNELKIGDKVELGVVGIENPEYRFQFSGVVRKTVYVYDVIDLSCPTFVFKTTPRAKTSGVLPVKFITKVVSSGTKLYY